MTLKLQSKGAPLKIENKDGRATVKGSPGADRIVLSERDGKLLVTSFGKSGQGGYETREAVIDPSRIKSLTIDAGGGNDRIIVDKSVRPDRNYLLLLKGGEGDDGIEGGRGSEKIDGGSGRDHVHAGGGNDFVRGGKGDDVLNGGAGDDKIEDFDGRNRIFAGEGEDAVSVSARYRDLVRGNGATRVADERDFKRVGDDLRKRFGVTVENGKDRRWSLDELETLQKTLASLPPSLQEAARGLRFKREIMDGDHPNRVEGDFSRRGQVRLYDLAVDGEDAPSRERDLRTTIVHEIAHAYDWKDGKYSKTAFWDLSGWRKNGKEYVSDRTDNFARSYGRTNPEEDWATSVEMYFTEPERLRRNAPDKYEFLMRHFQ